MSVINNLTALKTAKKIEKRLENGSLKFVLIMCGLIIWAGAVNQNRSRQSTR